MSLLATKRAKLRRAMEARSRSRSRSVTPFEGDARDRTPTPQLRTRRALLARLVAEGPVRQPESSTPPRVPHCIPVQATPSDSLHVSGGEVPLHVTPGGRVRRVQGITDSLIYNTAIIEREEALDMSEEEGEELLEQAPWHVQQWIEDLSPLPPPGSAPPDSAPPGSAALAVSPPTTGRLGHQTCLVVPSIASSTTTDVTAIHPEVEVRPSTSGVMTARPRVVASRRVNSGSDFDSEFDDEFNNETAAIAAVQRNMPDIEDLDDPVQQLVSDFETGIDDEADRLLGTSPSFTWVEDFESFRAVREDFSGPTPGPVKDYDSPYDVFTDIWDKDIIQLIVRETNRYAKQTIETLRSSGGLKPSSRLHLWTDTNEDEIMTLFAVFMLMGIDPRPRLKDYWSLGILEIPYFKRVMTYNRYLLLSKFLHFVDNNAVESQHDSLQTEGFSSATQPRLGKMAPIIEHLGRKFDSLYNLAPEISIDESLTLFKGRLSWVQTIRTKSARFGIKSYELCEARTGYMARFQIYTGKYGGSGGDPSLGVNLGGKSTKVVLDLLRGLERRGHCVTMDNFYNCPSLARYLKSLGFDCLGTLRGNRRNVPSDIAKVSKRVAKGTIISRHCGDVSIIAWKDSKMVNIISTFHNNDTYVGKKAGRSLVKPVCISDYNTYMGGVDLKDQKLSMYLLERKRGVKWYMKMYKRLKNVSIHNAYIMYNASMARRNKPLMTHRDFRDELARSLLAQHRPCLQGISVPPQDIMRLRRDIMHEPKYVSRKDRKRCTICYRKEKSSKFIHSGCITCDVFLCFGECWSIWHSDTHLPGDEIRGRKRRPRE